MLFSHQGVGGIVVSIAAFQAVDPGSIPGRRNNRFLFDWEKNNSEILGFHPV